LLEYDDVMNLQRRTVYELRRVALETDDASDIIRRSVEELTDDILAECIDVKIHAEEWLIEDLRKSTERAFGMEWSQTDIEIRDMAFDEIRSEILNFVYTRYAEQEEKLGAESLRELEKKMLLHFTDQYWKDHLLAMDRLRHGVSLRGYGQQNPLLEYKREGTEMFMLMCSLRDEAVLTQLLAFSPDMLMPSMNASRQATERILDVAQQAPQQDPNADIPDLPINIPMPKSIVSATPTLPKMGAEARLFGVRNAVDKNAPCPCGSEKKFKKCCRKAEVDPTELALAQEEAAERKAAVAALKAERQAQIDALKAQEEAASAQEPEQSTEVTGSTGSTEGTDSVEMAEDSGPSPLDLALEEVPDGFFGSMDFGQDENDEQEGNSDGTEVVKDDGLSEDV